MRLILLALLLVTGFVVHAQRACESYEYKQQLLRSDAIISQQIQATEAFIQSRLNNREQLSTASGSIQAGIPLITIPVVVHVVYNSESQNISDAQVLSQLEVLNRDFRRLNADTSQTPGRFLKYAADCFIQFKLATNDPEGKPTTGIIRKKTTIQLFGLDDRIKQSAIGGDDAWDSDTYLNIWVGNLAGGMLGYSSLPGGPKSTDGIVVRSSAFGTNGTATAPFNLGRTATHELGHWLGLQHIWGDTYCGNDQVEDTPPQQSASRGCPTGNITSCSNDGTMYMNFMDFTNDACTNMFTQGQRDRMRVVFQPGGPRYALATSQAASGKPVLVEIKPVELTPINKPSEIEVYPNPFQSRLNIRFPNGKQQPKQLVTIYNHLGQLVKQLYISDEGQSVDVSELRPGIYFMKAGETKSTLKIVKR